MNTVLERTLAEGYGSGAWHGPNLKEAMANVPPALALWRPAPGRHNIAEIALHHAFYVHSVRGRITGVPLAPFVVADDDWTGLPGPSGLDWAQIQSVVDEEQRQLLALAGEVAAGRVVPAQPEADVFGLVLGITCHAVYHAGQIQLIRRLYPG